MRHEMLTQRARFCIGVMAKKGTLSQHFVTHVVPPLGGVRQDHVWCVFAESAIIFPIDFVWKLEPAISLSLYPVWRILVLN